MQEHATALADAIEHALPGWVVARVERTLVASRGAADASVLALAAEAGRQAAATVGPQVRALLAADIDEQRTTPLALVRDAVRYPTAILRDAGVAPVARDPQQVALFPDDVYDLSPATFADVDPPLADLGIAWGAAKAMAHRQRHGAAR